MIHLRSPESSQFVQLVEIRSKEGGKISLRPQISLRIRYFDETNNRSPFRLRPCFRLRVIREYVSKKNFRDAKMRYDHVNGQVSNKAGDRKSICTWSLFYFPLSSEAYSTEAYST